MYLKMIIHDFDIIFWAFTVSRLQIIIPYKSPNYHDNLLQTVAGLMEQSDTSTNAISDKILYMVILVNKKYKYLETRALTLFIIKTN